VSFVSAHHLGRSLGLQAAHDFAGGRMRWELSQSLRLAAVREALAGLKAAGFTDTGIGSL
jgi:hypothetical protein